MCPVILDHERPVTLYGAEDLFAQRLGPQGAVWVGEAGLGVERTGAGLRESPVQGLRVWPLG